MSARRSSKRLKDAAKSSRPDRELQKRMEAKRLANLERDNFHEDPEEGEALLKFEGVRQTRDKRSRLRRSALAEYFKTRFKKTLDELVAAEDRAEEPNYETARAPPPIRPPRRFCAVCGFFSKYNCVRCDAKYCSLKCREMHAETRCMKYVV